MKLGACCLLLLAVLGPCAAAAALVLQSGKLIGRIVCQTYQATGVITMCLVLVKNTEVGVEIFRRN